MSRERRHDPENLHLTLYSTHALSSRKYWHGSLVPLLFLLLPNCFLRRAREEECLNLQSNFKIIMLVRQFHFNSRVEVENKLKEGFQRPQLLQKQVMRQIIRRDRTSQSRRRVRPHSYIRCMSLNRNRNISNDDSSSILPWR